MSVTLRKKINKDGSKSLILDIYYNGERKREYLKHLKLAKPSNLADRENNKSRLQQAEAIAVTRAAELSAQDYSMVSDAGKKTIVTAWMQTYIDDYKKKDKRNMEGVLGRFKTFLQLEKKPHLTFGNLDALIIEDFIEYLESKSKGEGASSYYNRFKKMIKYAYQKRLIKENPIEFVQRRVKGEAKKKDVLTIAEIQKLASTELKNKEIRRAFLFSCLTGIRWVDINHLIWGNIKWKENNIVFNQSKTGKELSIPMNDSIIKLLGVRDNLTELIFNLPSSNGANKSLRAWLKKAEINKHITWHNARHSFGTNLILNNTEFITTSRLLGHSTPKHTNRYVNTAEEIKQAAMKNMNVEL